MNYVKSVLLGLWGHIVDNWPVILKALLAVWFFFQGIHTYIFSVIALTIIDVVTGVYAAYKNGEKITSRKLRKGLLEKLALYLILLVSVFTLDTVLITVITVDTFYLSGLITFLIATYEVTSITENINAIRPNIPFIQGLIKVFKKMGTKTIEKLDEKVDDLADKITDFKAIGGDKAEGDMNVKPTPEQPTGEA